MKTQAVVEVVYANKLQVGDKIWTGKSFKKIVKIEDYVLGRYKKRILLSYNGVVQKDECHPRAKLLRAQAVWTKT